ncbi:unnamed protein product, partial [Coregonus sp. 'balchen']
ISDPYPSIQNTCRLCGQNLLIKGTLQATRRIFDNPKASKEKKLCDRFLATGLVLTEAPGDRGICKRFKEMAIGASYTGDEREEEALVITYPNQLDPKLKKRVEKVSSEFSGMVENLAKGKLTTFVRLALTNETICQEIRKQMTQKIEAEVKAYARPLNYLTSAEPCILSSTSLENLKAFSYEALDDELSRKTPWLYTTINTATGGSTIHNCVAASVALRGRNPRLSALAYVINSTLTQGGVKPIFKRLSKMVPAEKSAPDPLLLLNQQRRLEERRKRRTGGPVEEEFEIELDWGPLEEEGEGEEEEWSPVSEETEREEDRGSTEQGETEREEDGGSTEEEERGEEAEWGSLLGETEREEEEGRTSSVLEGNDRQEEDSDSTVDSETEYFGLNLTCESD